MGHTGRGPRGSSDDADRNSVPDVLSQPMNAVEVRVAILELECAMLKLDLATRLKSCGVTDILRPWLESLKSHL
jgi:hypothetical protein